MCGQELRMTNCANQIVRSRTKSCAQHWHNESTSVTILLLGHWVWDFSEPQCCSQSRISSLLSPLQCSLPFFNSKSGNPLVQEMLTDTCPGMVCRDGEDLFCLGDVLANNIIHCMRCTASTFATFANFIAQLHRAKETHKTTSCATSSNIDQPCQTFGKTIAQLRILHKPNSSNQLSTFHCALGTFCVSPSTAHM